MPTKTFHKARTTQDNPGHKDNNKWIPDSELFSEYCNRAKIDVSSITVKKTLKASWKGIKCWKSLGGYLHSIVYQVSIFLTA